MDSVSLQIRLSTSYEEFTLSALPSACNLGSGQLRLIYDAAAYHGYRPRNDSTNYVERFILMIRQATLDHVLNSAVIGVIFSRVISFLRYPCCASD